MSRLHPCFLMLIHVRNKTSSFRGFRAEASFCWLQVDAKYTVSSRRRIALVFEAANLRELLGLSLSIEPCLLSLLSWPAPGTWRCCRQACATCDLPPVCCRQCAHQQRAGIAHSAGRAASRLAAAAVAAGAPAGESFAAIAGLRRLSMQKITVQVLLQGRSQSANCRPGTLHRNRSPGLLPVRCKMAPQSYDCAA